MRSKLNFLLTFFLPFHPAMIFHYFDFEQLDLVEFPVDEFASMLHEVLFINTLPSRSRGASWLSKARPRTRGSRQNKGSFITN